jgi:hypothetical protein
MESDKDNSEELRRLEKRKKQLQQELKKKQIEIDFYEKMIEIAQDDLGVEFRLKPDDHESSASKDDE